VAQAWVAIGILGGFAIGVLAMMWSRMDRLDTKIDGLRVELSTEMRAQGQGIHTLAERQAEMNGEMHILREMAHTHSTCLRYAIPTYLRRCPVESRSSGLCDAVLTPRPGGRQRSQVERPR
jgi:hypothetical protein